MNARAGLARWIVISALAAVVAISGGIYLAISNAQRQEAFAVQIVEARELLRVSRNDDALATLSSLDDFKAPAEYHYLKAITLDRLKRFEPANSEIARAIALSPENPRYKGLELRFRLMAREKSAMDQLIELNRDYASVAAVALFSTYAFQAKGLWLNSTGNPKSAQYHHSRKVQTLDTALTMSADIPELHPELMQFAVSGERPQDALRLVNGMLDRDPKSLELRSQKIRILVAAGQPDEAAGLSLELYEETGKKLKGAEYVASVLAQATSSETNDRLFLKLLQDFGRSPVIVTKHAVYLARHGHLQGAQKYIDEAMQRMKSADDRETLAFVSISLPLEAKVADLAEEQMRRNGQHLRDQLLKDYFNARLLYLRERHSEAVQLMLKIVKSGGTDSGSPALAQEALAWVRQILSEKVLREQMEKVVRAAGMAGSSPVKVRVAEESELQTTATPENEAPAETETPEQTDRQPSTDSAAGAASAPEEETSNED